MARTGINYDDVKSAATTLLARGENPTIQRIRELLGTGSNTTISAYLKQWQEQRATDMPVIELPPALPQDLVPALEVFWQSAIEHAEKALAHYREEVRLEREQALQEREEAFDQARLLQQQLQQSEQTLQAIKAQLEAQANDLLEARQVVQSLRIECAELQQQYCAVQQANKVSEQTLAQTRNEHNATLTAYRNEAREQLRETQQRYQVSEQQWLQLIEQLRTEQGQREQQWKQVQQTAEQHWQSQQQALQEQLKQARTALTHVQTQNARLSEQARAAQQRLSDTEQQLNAQRSEKELLIRDNAILQQQLRTHTQEQAGLRQELEQTQQLLTQLQHKLQTHANNEAPKDASKNRQPKTPRQ